MKKISGLMWVVIICLTIAGALIGAIAGELDYKYQVDKCKNMKDSNYRFDIKLETNAQYANDCYWQVNHPLAEVSSVAGCAFLMGLMLGLAGILLALLINSNQE